MKVVVSGASSGLGLSIVRYLLKEHHQVIGFGRRKEVSINHDNFTYYSLDFTKSCNFECKETAIDAIVYCSAQFKSKQIEEHSIVDIENMISVNLTGAIKFVRYFKSKMKDSGNIILISSVSGLRGQPLQSVYSATKHGLQGFADALNHEVSQKITTICPGGINTPLWNDSNPYMGNVDKLLSPDKIASIINSVIVTSDIIYKNITIYPENERH